MKPPRVLTSGPTNTIFISTAKLAPNVTRVLKIRPSGVKFPANVTTISRPDTAALVRSLSTAVSPDTGSGPARGLPGKLEGFEEHIEKGCTYVVSAFQQYLVNRGKVIFLLVEAIDVYLLGTVMLVFGVGLYELFISTLDTAKLQSEENFPYRSNLFGLFTLKERPKWLEIKTVNELKTKLGHVIVMLLLIGLFDKSMKAIIHSPVDLLCFSASVCLCSGCLYLLSRLNGSN
ncbi:GREB1-like protein [Actinidia chinensis var. chinensis]|uniref:GREB1-like protein n=1 Tax=Actinidia chinensis var. chinensis TaxID=1590841 RepID=A0A2R6PHU1_ACTCC|nr:GREB1-like protein [Actinidia chinensis var. chinensis]